ncbi:unnamed protein product, partial [Cladocopium goreaui]
AMMSRSLSVPSSSRDHAAADGTGTNPFYSERLQQEIALHERRPKHLPADDEGRVPPVQDGRPPTGKGRGGDGTGLFATPPSLERPTVFGQQPTGMQSQGAMPMDGPLRGRMGDPGWKPTNEKSLSPQDAKSAWLEREVNSLKKVLEKVATDGNSFEISKAWPLKEGQQFWSSGMPPMPVEAPSLEQRRLLHGELVHGDRASLQGASTLHGTVLGEPQLQARALHGVGQSVHGDGALHDRALHGAALGDGALHGRALHGTVLGDGALQGRALHGTVLGDGALHDRALHGLRRSLGFKILFNKGILFKEHKGKELWVLHQCQHHGNLLVEVVAESWSCQRCQMDVEIKMQLQQTTKRLSSKLQLEKVMMVELQAQQLIKPLLVQALMVQDWVLRDHMCHLYTKAGEKIDVELHNGCPYVAHEFGAKLLTVLEQHQIQQELKKMTLKSILTRGAAGLGNNMSIEMAMLVKLKEVMPTLPEDLALKLVPDLSVLTDPNIGLNIPWNRRKRKRLMMAKNVIIHMYSGPDASYWERRLSNEHTEVLCVHLEASTPSNALDETTFAFLLSLCASKRVKALLGGPPCRTTSALRFQKDDGPPILRTEDHPYGLPSLTPQQAELVTNDSILWLRLMLMYILCEEVRPKEQAQSAFLCEQPQDPAEYRKKEDVDEHQYFSMWRTQEWKSFQEAYNAKLISFDQGLQLLKQSADGFAVKRLHVKDLKIILALFTPMTMSDLLVKITHCLALMTLNSLVILKNNNLEMVNHLNNMLNEINNKRAMKLNMNKVFLQVLHKMNLILSKKNRPEDPEIRAAQVRSHGSRERVHAGAASAMSFLVGQTLLAEAEALEIKGEQDEADPLWIAAVVLMPWLLLRGSPRALLLAMALSMR